MRSSKSLTSSTSDTAEPINKMTTPKPSLTGSSGGIWAPSNSPTSSYYRPRSEGPLDSLNGPDMSVISVADWEAIVSTHFSFLEERFHWTLWAKDDSGHWETTITYARDPAAVIVRCSAEFNRAEVEFVRMVAGDIPPVPIFVHSNTRIDRCELDNLLLLRDSSMLEGLRNLSGLDRQTVDQALAPLRLAR